MDDFVIAKLPKYGEISFEVEISDNTTSEVLRMPMITINYPQPQQKQQPQQPKQPKPHRQPQQPHQPHQSQQQPQPLQIQPDQILKSVT